LFRVSGGAGGGGPSGKPVARVVGGGHARRNVADGGAVVDKRFAAAVIDPLLHWRDADLKFEGAGDAIAGFVFIVLVVLAVGVQIDETRGNDVPFGFNGLLASKRSGAEGGDDAVDDAEGTNGVEIGGGIDDASVVDDSVEVRLTVGGGCGRGGEEMAARKRHFESVAPITGGAWVGRCGRPLPAGRRQRRLGVSRRGG